MNQATVERLEKAFHKARVKYQNAKDEYENKTEIPRFKSMVGTHWRYRNSYSCPKGPEDYWFVYRRIDSLNKSGEVTYSEFQCDKDGKVSLEICTDRPIRFLSMTGWSQTDKATYDHAFRSVTDTVKKIGSPEHTRKGTGVNHGR